VLHYNCASLLVFLILHFHDDPKAQRLSAEHIARTSYMSSQKHSTKFKWHWHRQDFMVVTQRFEREVSSVESHNFFCRSHQRSRIRIKSFNFCRLSDFSVYPFQKPWGSPLLAIIKSFTSPTWLERSRNPARGQWLICIAS